MSIREKPWLTQHSTTAPTIIGATYVFQVEAYNINGHTFSDSIGFVFGSTPDKPLDSPISELTVSTADLLRINYSGVAINGGSPIISYSLEIDDGSGGDFVSLYGDVVDTMTLSYTFTSNVKKGQTYRARYRAKNLVGWSGYSPIGYLTAASAPDAPPAPLFVSATSTSISVIVPRVLENGGSPVISYELLIDDGIGGNFIVVTSYDQNPTFTINQSV